MTHEGIFSVVVVEDLNATVCAVLLKSEIRYLFFVLFFC